MFEQPGGTLDCYVVIWNSRMMLYLPDLDYLYA